MAAVVVPPTSAPAAAKTLPATAAPRALSLRLRLVDGQGSSAQIGPVERRNRFIGFAGIRHFYEPETSGAACIPVGHERDFFHRSVRFEKASQLGFGCAVG